MGDVVHVHGRLGLREVTDPPRQDVELPGCAHRVDDGLALRRNSATNDLPVTKEMTKEAALLVLGKPQPDRLRIGTQRVDDRPLVNPHRFGPVEVLAHDPEGAEDCLRLFDFLEEGVVAVEAAVCQRQEAPP